MNECVHISSIGSPMEGGGSCVCMCAPHTSVSSCMTSVWCSLLSKCQSIEAMAVPLCKEKLFFSLLLYTVLCWFLSTSSEHTDLP